MVLALSSLLPYDPQNYQIVVNTDNIAPQQVLEVGRGKDPVLCTCARQIWLISAMNNFSISITHKPGSELVLADALSRCGSSEHMANVASEYCKKHRYFLILICNYPPGR